jgi:GT2 family glycosyltransferase
MKAGIVVIGRNEGERLVRSLESAHASGCPILYVDSGSTDGSARRARALGVEVLELDASRPFSAARARNEGVEALLARRPDLECVQFLDADCVLAPGWPQIAGAVLAQGADRAAVVGHLHEINEGASVYNRLCALEWRSAPGELADFGQLGGISLMRVAAFRELGGFRPQVIAGEDSELGVRLKLAGYRVLKIDRPMAGHDAAMSRFGQWWRRAVRAGHAIGQRYELNGRSALRDCSRERRSTLFWGLGLPIAAAALAWPSGGASLALLLAYPLLGYRVWRHRRAMGDAAGDALLYAGFIVPAKFANAVGLLVYYRNRWMQSFHVIEYK